MGGCFREPLKVYERKARPTYESLKPTPWDCKYQVGFIPKCRRKGLYHGRRRELGEGFRRLAEQWEGKVVEGPLMPDQVHMLLLLPPKDSGSQGRGFVKGKRAIHIARGDAGRRRHFGGQHFWARGYWGATVSKNEAAVREYIRNQEKEEQRLEQLVLLAL